MFLKAEGRSYASPEAPWPSQRTHVHASVLRASISARAAPRSASLRQAATPRIPGSFRASSAPRGRSHSRSIRGNEWSSVRVRKRPEEAANRDLALPRVARRAEIGDRNSVEPSFLPGSKTERPAGAGLSAIFSLVRPRLRLLERAVPGIRRVLPSLSAGRDELGGKWSGRKNRSNRRKRLPWVATGGGRKPMVRRGRRFESVRGLEVPASPAVITRERLVLPA
jgi:hypothetical protein